MENTYRNNNNVRNIGVNLQVKVTRGDLFYADLGERISGSTTGNVGSEQSGRRIILVIQNWRGNLYSPCTIIASVSSQLHKAKLPTHVDISVSECDALDKNSVILLEQIRTADKVRLLEKIGSLSSDKMDSVDKAIATSVGLDSMINKMVQEAIEKEKQELIKQQKEEELIEVEETIEDMVRGIKELEQFALRESTSNPEEFLRVRKIHIAGLKKYCNKKDVNIYDYYNEEEFEIRFENLKKYAESLGNNKNTNVRPMMPISAMTKYNTIAVTC